MCVYENPSRMISKVFASGDSHEFPSVCNEKINYIIIRKSESWHYKIKFMIIKKIE
jgi:hypothetical protein